MAVSIPLRSKFMQSAIEILNFFLLPGHRKQRLNFFVSGLRKFLNFRANKLSQQGPNISKLFFFRSEIFLSRKDHQQLSYSQLVFFFQHARQFNKIINTYLITVCVILNTDFDRVRVAFNSLELFPLRFDEAWHKNFFCNILSPLWLYIL